MVRYSDDFFISQRPLQPSFRVVILGVDQPANDVILRILTLFLSSLMDIALEFDMFVDGFNFLVEREPRARTAEPRRQTSA